MAKARRGRQAATGAPADPTPAAAPRALAGRRRSPRRRYAIGRRRQPGRPPGPPRARRRPRPLRLRHLRRAGTWATAGTDRGPGSRCRPVRLYRPDGIVTAWPPRPLPGPARAGPGAGPPGRRRHQAAHPRRRRAGRAARRGRPPDPRGRRRRGRPVQGRRALPLPHPGRPGGGHGGPDHRAVRRGHRRLPARRPARPGTAGPAPSPAPTCGPPWSRSTAGEERLGAALLAAAAAEPELLVPLQEAADGWQARLVDDGLDPTTATVVRLACDGLWLCGLFGLAAPTATCAPSVGAALEQMTGDAVMIRRGPAGAVGALPSDASVRPHPHPGRHRLPRSGWGRRPSSPCCPSTSASWAAPTRWPAWSWRRSSPPGCSSSTRWAGWPTGSAASRCCVGRPGRLRAWPASPSCCHIAPAMAIAAARPAGPGGRRRRGGRAGHGVGCGGRRAAGPGLRLHLRRRDRRHGRGPADRRHRRGPPHVDHVPRLGRRLPAPPASPPLRIVEPRRGGRRCAGRAPTPTGRRRPARPAALEPLDGRRPGGGRRPRPHHRRLRHLLDPAPGVAGRGRLADRRVVDAVRRALRGRRPAQRLAGRPHGPAATWSSAASASPWCSAPPTRSSTSSRC